MKTRLGLIVLRTANMETMLAFYRALGLTLVEEKHGSGPIHYSCELGDTVIELYPADSGTAPERKSGGATMLGFVVESLDTVLGTLQELGTRPESPPKESAWGRRAIVLDPDGRAIEISEPPKV